MIVRDNLRIVCNYSLFFIMGKIHESVIFIKHYIKLIRGETWYVSVLESKDKIYVKSIKDVYFKIEKKTAFQFLYTKTEFKIDELLEYFSKDEIFLLKEIR